jgi:hypothetical protein
LDNASSAFERNGKALHDQDFANIAAIGLKNAALTGHSCKPVFLLGPAGRRNRYRRAARLDRERAHETERWPGSPANRTEQPIAARSVFEGEAE